jgi:hypothetical protein
MHIWARRLCSSKPHSHISTTNIYTHMTEMLIGRLGKSLNELMSDL